MVGQIWLGHVHKREVSGKNLRAERKVASF